MASKGFTHTDLFNDNSGGWTLSNATISGGILNITATTGSGTRYPDSDWIINNDFIIEADVRLQGGAGERIWRVVVGLIDGGTIHFEYRAGATDKIRLHYPIGTVRVSQSEAIDNDNWHSVKVRRVGTVYYFSVDGHSEISYDVGTEYVVSLIQLYMENNVGDYDNFKFYWIKPILEGAVSFSGAVSKKQFKILEGAISFIGTLSISKLYKKLLEGGISFIGTLSRKVSYKRIQEGAISFIGTLQRKLSLHRLLEGSISFIGTLLGSRLFKKTLEGAISFIGTLSRTRTYRRTLEGIISFVGKLKVTKLWRAVSKMSNIWTPEDKRSNVWTPQDKRDNDWIEE